jgi:hypothetical protein
MLRGAVFGSNVYSWPDGGGEAVVYFDHGAGSDLPDKPKRLFVKAGAAGDPEGSRIEAARRARGRVRRLARHGGFRYMWTLTMPGAGVHRLDEARKVLTTWMNGPGHRRGRGPGSVYFQGAYIAIPELHPGGHGWHWHVLTNRGVTFQLLQVSWTRHLHGRGLCSGTALARVHVKSFGSSRSAASYASKYVTKVMQGHELGRHRYHVGDGVESPCPVYRLVMGADVWEATYEVLAPYLAALPRTCRVKGAGPPATWSGW